MWTLRHVCCVTVLTYFSPVCSAKQVIGFYMKRNTGLKWVKGRNLYTELLLNDARRSGVFIVNFEHISQLVLVFLLLTLNM